VNAAPPGDSNDDGEAGADAGDDGSVAYGPACGAAAADDEEFPTTAAAVVGYATGAGAA
jgi:hypothetical protein